MPQCCEQSVFAARPLDPDHPIHDRVSLLGVDPARVGVPPIFGVSTS